MYRVEIHGRNGGLRPSSVPCTRFRAFCYFPLLPRPRLSGGLL